MAEALYLPNPLAMNYFLRIWNKNVIWKPKKALKILVCFLMDLFVFFVMDLRLAQQLH